MSALGIESPSELIGKNFIDYIHPDARQATIAALQALQTDGVHRSRAEFTLTLVDGRTLEVEASSAPLTYEGHVARIFVIRDIAERQLAEAQVRFQAKLLEQVSDAIISLDLNRIVTYWNRGSERLYGWTSDEVIGKSLSNFVTTRVVTDTAENVIRAVMETGSWSAEYVQTRKDGTSFSVVNTTTLLRDTRGNPVGYVGINRDITESKRADEARARLTAIVESSDDAIISETLDGTIMSWNAGAERIFGYAAAEIIGKSITLLIPPDQVAEETKILEMIVWGERIEHYETVRVSKEGQHPRMSMTISPLRDDSGQIIGVSKIARDISGLKRAEEVLRHHASQIEALADLSQTLASVSFHTEALAKTITEHIANLIGDVCVLRLRSNGEQSFEIAAYHHPNPQAKALLGQMLSANDWNTAQEQSISGTGQAVLTPNITQEHIHTFLQSEHSLYRERFGFHSLLIVPMRVQGKIIGIVSVSRDSAGHPYNNDDQEFLQELADRAALAIQNARLFEEVNTGREQM